MSTPSFLRAQTLSPEPVERQPVPKIWPAPTTDKPDLETLAAWFFDQGGSEATDGCWVTIDGICPHGYPSWFIQFGMIEG